MILTATVKEIAGGDALGVTSVRLACEQNNQFRVFSSSKFRDGDDDDDDDDGDKEDDRNH
jgi:hypothetical protein